MWIKLQVEIFPLINISCFTHLFIIDLQICQWFKAKSRLLNFLLLRYFYLFQGLLCVVLGVNTGFLCYNCLVMTIDSTLSVQELSNGNSLLLILMFLHPFLCLRLGRSSLYLPFLFLLCFQCHSLQHHLSSATIVTTFESQTFPLVIHVKSPLLSPPPKTCRVVLLNPWAWLKSPTSKVW